MASTIQAEKSFQAGPAFQAGQVWSYVAPQGFEDSRVLIGAIVSFEDGERVVCCAVEGAPQKLGDGRLGRMTIPFLPMAEQAFARTVVGLDGQGLAPPAFAIPGPGSARSGQLRVDGMATFPAAGSPF